MAIVVDSANATSATGSSGTLNYSHTLGLASGNNRVVVVGVTLKGSAGSLSITYDGQAMNFIRQEVISSERIALAYLLDADLPSTSGSYTVSSAYTGTITGDGHASGCFQMSNVKQQAPEADAGGVNPFPATALSTNITTLTDGAMMVDLLGTVDDGLNKVTFQTADAGQTKETEWNTDDINGGMSTELSTPAGLETMGWTWGAGSIPALQIIAAFAPDDVGPPAPRDIRTHHKTFAGPSTTGSFTVDNIGFIPKAAWIWCARVTDESVTADSVLMSGFCDTALSQVSVTAGSENGAQNTYRDRNTSNIINIRESTGVSVIAQAAVTAFNDDEMVLNFTTLLPAGQDLIFHVIFFGGEDLQAELVSPDVDSSPVTGMSFQPEFAITHGHNDGGGLGQFCTLSVGAFNDELEEFHHVIYGGNDAADQDVKEALVRTSGFSGQLFQGAMSWEASIASITSDGFSWTGTDPNDTIDALCFNLGGINTHVGSFTKSAAAAPVTQDLPTLGFESQLYCLMTADRTSETPIGVSSTYAAHGIGAYDRGRQSHVFKTDVNNSTNSDMRSNLDDVVGGGTADAAYDSLAHALPIIRSQIDPARVEWDPNDASATIHGIWAWARQPRADQFPPSSV